MERSQQLVNEANELIKKRNKLSWDLIELLQEIPLWIEFSELEDEIYEMTNKILMQKTVEHCFEKGIELFDKEYQSDRAKEYIANLELPEDIPQVYLSNDEAESIYWDFYTSTKRARESHVFTTEIEDTYYRTFRLK